jgi:prepilin-type N-terminal cleavage/methylation domain-containing protein
MQHKLKGFTLIELLIVIALIAVLAGAVIVALNPARQFANARNSTRWSHLSTIANAVQQNIAENKGLWTCPAVPTLPATSSTIEKVGGSDLCDCLVPNQIASLPFDPGSPTFHVASCAEADYNTGYTIVQDAVTHRITVTAPEAENGAVIAITQ